MRIPIEIRIGIFFITLCIIGGIFLVRDAHRESDKNIERAELFLSETWGNPFTIDKNHLSGDSVIFYSGGNRYKINTYDWSVER